MNWRITVNGAVLVMAISSGAVANATTSRLVANDARTVLSTIKVENEYKTGYRRSLFVHWSDLDGNGCDTREEVLKRDSTSRPQVDSYRCYVVAGDWYSPYDGTKLSDRGDVDVDHVVALKEAWDSGAWSWSESQRKAYANDLTDRRTLIAVRDRVNASKSDKDPSNWMPPLRSYWCAYLGDWISVKARWGLSMDQSEFGRIKNLLNSDCASLMIAGWAAAPVTLPNSTTGATSTTTINSTSTVAPTTSRATSSSVTTAPATQSTATPSVTTPGVKDIYPGSYCAPVDGLGTYKGASYICSKTNAEGSPYAGSRARWRKATN